MARHIYSCVRCGRYTMSQSCPDCGGEAITTQPPKYSPEDKYGSYRRKAKKAELESRGLL